MDSIPPEHRGRLAIEECSGLLGMEAMSQDISTDLPKNGVSRRGYLRVESVPSAATVFQLEARSGLPSNGRLPPGLESGFPVRIPAILFNHSRAQSSANAASKQNGSHCANMAVTAVVSTTTVHGHNDAIVSFPTPQTIVKPQGPDSPFITKFLSKPSGLAGLRDRLKTEGVSEEVINIMLHSRRQGITKTYESAWKNWRLWCGRRSADPTRCSVVDGLDYLADLYQQGRPYRSIALHRSAISAYHNPMVVGNALVPVGRHPMISTLMSGVHNLRPPVAKYSFT